MLKVIYRRLPLWIAVWVVIAIHAAAPRAEEPAPSPTPASPVIVREQPMFDSSLLDFAKVFGLGGMIFVIWLFDYRRQRGLESIIEKYDETQQSHLAAFKDINDRHVATFAEAMKAMQKVSEDAQSTAILCAQVNTRIAERLDHLAKEHSR